MKLASISVKNFKAVVDVRIDNTDVALLVGANNSGKSSILQAIHFASRALHQASEANKQSTISLRELEYVPTELYAELAHNNIWGNRSDAPESTVTFEFRDELSDPAKVYKASISLKSARNEGIAVNPRIDQSLIPVFRAKNTVFSAYIPGIAGIPLQETFISKRNVYRKAASGDSNVVLRNILYLLSRTDKLSIMIEKIRKLYQDKTIDISVRFDNNNDYNFYSSFKTKNMSRSKPIELAGTGMLQAIQIFSYLYLFRPNVILIDEPEAHLHPPLQTRLVQTLQEAVRDISSSAIISTHSPFVAKGLEVGARTIWLDRGKVAAQSKDREIRDALGWGALDKQAIICAEDRDVRYLSELLAQDEVCGRDIAVIPFSGVSKLGSSAALAAYGAALGNRHKIIIYRDRDCLTDAEIETWSQEYKNAGFGIAVPNGVEIENAFCTVPHISASLALSEDDAEAIYDEAVAGGLAELKAKFRRKRKEINSSLHSDGGSPQTDDLWESFDDQQRLPGKMLLAKINGVLQNKGYKERIDRVRSNHVTEADFIARVRSLLSE